MRLPRTGFVISLRASATRLTTKSGIDEFTIPASSMKRASNPLARAFQLR